MNRKLPRCRFNSELVNMNHKEANIVQVHLLVDLSQSVSFSTYIAPLHEFNATMLMLESARPNTMIMGICVLPLRQAAN